MDIEFNELKANGAEIGEIILNRAHALNALTFDMIVAMSEALQRWQKADNIKAVIVRSSSKKAFCAGGDVVGLYKQCIEQDKDPMPFFKHEYQLNCLIRNYNKPYICLLDGLTIGGGVGISLHGAFPVATENFSFAMPETGIGFFPDVGGGYLLTRCHQAFGVYLALTGKRINRADALAAGLIKYAIASDAQAAFIDALLTTNLYDSAKETIENLLAQFAIENTEKSSLIEQQQQINQAFAADSLEDILASLESMVNEWSDKTYQLLLTKAPMALKVTLEQMKRCQGLTMEQTMALEYRMVSRFMKTSDFFEGVRALLVDKDKQPKWQPAHITEILNQDVLQYFAPIKDELWDNCNNLPL